MISRTTFCSAQASVIRPARTRPIPFTSRSRSGSASMTGYSGEVEQRFRGSGTRFPAKWNARRSVATFVGQFPPLGVAADLQDSTRDVVFESMDEDACGACGRRLRRPRCCGKRAFGDRSVAPNASRAFSTSPAGSTGRSDPTCPGHACRRRDGSGLRFRRGNGVAVLVLMSSPSGGCSARRAYVASSGPSARCGARRGAGGRRWRRPGWGHR